MSLKVIEPNKVIQDAIYIEDFEFNCGRKVPIYQVNSIYALTQMIGYAKYINASYGNDNRRNGIFWFYCAKTLFGF